MARDSEGFMGRGEYKGGGVTIVDRGLNRYYEGKDMIV